MRKKDDNKIDALHEATIALVNEIGIAETTVAKIAKRANVSAATLYIYYENKEDLLRQTYLKCKDRLTAVLFTGMDAALPLRERFGLLLRRFAFFIEQFREPFLFMEQISSSPLLERWCLEEAIELYGRMNALFEEGRQKGLFKDEELQLLVLYAVVPAVQWVKENLKAGRTIEQMQLDRVIRLSWEAIEA